MTLPHHEFSPDYDYTQTPESIARAKAARDEERRTAGIPLDPDGFPIVPKRIVVMPVKGSRLSMDDRITCAEVIDRAIETFGMTEFMRAVRLVLLAHSISVEGMTIDELAQGMEKP